MEIPYHGESTCSVLKLNGKQCLNKAYYSIDNVQMPIYACGVHSKVNNRSMLIENPRKAEIIQERIAVAQTDAELVSLLNKTENKHGNVMVSKLLVMKIPEQIKGYILVFPNYHDKNRIIGLGMPELSPMSIKVNHSQPNLPPALLENFHQGNKCYPREAIDGEPSSVFFDNQKRMYNDEKPHRHKLFNWATDEEIKAEKEEAKQMKEEEKQMKVEANQRKEEEKKNKSANIGAIKLANKSTTAKKVTKKEDNMPLYSVFWNDGKMLKLTYAESRAIYCNLYEKGICELPEYTKLKNLILDGFNLQICGYDGYEITQTIAEHYADLSRPFGHELALYSMLTQDENISLPWKTV